MSAIFEIGLSNAVMVVLLAAVAAAATARKRHPALVHGLWLLVFVKLVTPPLVSVPVPLLWTWQEAPVADQTPAPPQSSRVGQDPWMPSDPGARRVGPWDDGPADWAIAESVWHGEEPLLAPAPGPEHSEALLDAAAGAGDRSTHGVATAAGRFWKPEMVRWVMVAVWLAGSLVWFGLSAILSWRVCRLLRLARPAPRELGEEVGRLARRLKLSRCPEIHVVSGRISPMVWSVGRRSRILFPRGLLGQLTPEERSAILAHELAHVRRGDGWVRLLEFIATGLYWWHPVVWWARTQLRRAEEECCDAWVVSTWPEMARTYAAALLETLDFLSRPNERRPLLPPVFSGTGTVRLLKRRLTMIYRQSTPARLGRKGRACLVVLAMLLLPIVPGPSAHATAEKAEDPAAEQQEATADLTPEPSRPAEWSGIRAFDGFDGRLALPWEPVRPDPSLMSLTKRPGMLTLTTHEGDIWGDISALAKNLYLIRNPLAAGSDFVATACLDSFKPTVSWQQAGLLVYDDDDNFLKWTCEFASSGQRILLVTREENGSPKARHIYADLDSDRLWLRLTKRGRLYEIASSTDGSTFTAHGEFLWRDGFPEQVGLMAMNGMTPDQTDAHFDFFEVRSLTPEEEDEPRLKERRRLQGAWESVSCRLSGKVLQEAPLSRLAFANGQATVTEKQKSLQFEYSLDLTKKPKRILLWHSRGGRTIAQPLLYSLRKNTLEVCLNPDPEGPTPTRLKTEEGDGLVLVTFSRVTKEWSGLAEDLAAAKNASPWKPEKQFDELDFDGDGQLSREEFTANCTAPESVRQAADILAISDRDGDGKLSIEEFKFRPRKAAFRSIDSDGDGFLSIKEYCRGEMRSASVARVQHVFDLMDRDDDGALSFEEFRNRPDKAWFANVDRNEDNRLTYDEFAAVNAGPVRDGRCPLMFAGLDRNGDGRLDFNEYSNGSDEVYFHKKDANADRKLSFQEYGVWLYTPEHIAAGEERFAKRDTDGDGFLSFREYAHRHGDADFWKMDRDGDGRVTLEEFRQHLRGAEKTGGAGAKEKPEGPSKEASDGSNEVAASSADDSLERLFVDRIDQNHDGSMSLEEFRTRPDEARLERLGIDEDGSAELEAASPQDQNVRKDSEG